MCIFILCAATPAAAQLWDVEKDSASASTKRVLTGAVHQVEDFQNWTPEVNQFQIYVNFDPADEARVPKIDIMSNKSSWPFTMKYAEDTLYVYIVPPGYTLAERAAINELPDEFPMVVWAGTQRATYWFSYASNEVALQLLTPAPFVSIEEVLPLADNIVPVQLLSVGPRSFKPIKELLKKFGGDVEIVQLEEAFYQDVWYRVRTATVQRYRVNETQLGTLVFFRVRDQAVLDTVRQQLADASR